MKILGVLVLQAREHEGEHEEQHRKRELHQYALPIALPVEPAFPQQSLALARDERPAGDVTRANLMARLVEVLVVRVVHQRLGFVTRTVGSGSRRVQRLSGRLRVATDAAPRDGKEHFLQGGARDAVTLEPERVQLAVQILEQVGKFGSGLKRQGEGELGAHVGRERRVVPDVLAHQRKYPVGITGRYLPLGSARRLTRQRQVVTGAVPILQKHRRPDARQLAGAHDGDAIAQEVSLVEEMRGQHDGRRRRSLADHLPGESARVRVHAARGLVQENHAGFSDEGDGERQLSLLPAGQLPRLVVQLFGQRHLVHRGDNLGRDRAFVHAPERGVES